MNKKAKRWILCFLLPAILIPGIAAALVLWIDPFFHYHKPLTDEFTYTLDNQRSQNDGIIKNFDYDAMIIGTSMADNFKTSELDELFGTNSIKTTFRGARFKEICEAVETAIEHQPELKLVVRSLDMMVFLEDKDQERDDLGEYPTYLYDDNIFNDVKYLFNRDVIFDRIVPILAMRLKNTAEPGITSFDEYSNWMKDYTFGMQSVCPDGYSAPTPAEAVHLTEEEKAGVQATIRQNVSSVAEANPDVDFYLYLTPYSAVWWSYLVANGTIYKQIEAEQVVIEELLPYENVHLFTFNHLTDITTDINNYKDYLHYGEWVNSLILKCMQTDRCRLTMDNYKGYLESELYFYTNYDYHQLIGQTDYEDDLEAERVLKERYSY